MASGSPKRDHIVVAAIDFGTTYSGYAYSFIDKPDKIITNERWVDENGCLSTFKTPTTILFDREGKFHSFGYDAEYKYASLAEKKAEEDDDEDDESSDEYFDAVDSESSMGPLGWKYFKRFKMNLYRQFDEQKIGKRINRHLMLKDDQNNQMEALRVFSSAIKFLSDDFLKQIKDRLENITPNDVHWVITVPAIWSDAAKQLMREAARMADIPDNRLTLALEPEVAAIYCREMSVRKKEEKGQGADLASFEIGETFLLLDIGGGTVDITCHEIMQGGKLKEKHRPTGGPWGGTLVDAAFFDLMKTLVGQDVWKKFTQDKLAEFLELQRSFEIKKKQIKDDEEFISMKVGKSLFQYFKKQNRTTLRKSLTSFQHEYHGQVAVVTDKIKIKRDLFLSLFEKSISAIVSHVKELLKKKGMEDINTILMVGGFSECKLMIERIKSAFPDLHVICPIMADLAVVQGAVMYGHSPKVISERSSPRTYGICVSVPFDERKHPSKCKYFDGETVMCTDIFKIMISIGENVIPGETVREHTCRPSRKFDTEAAVEVYESYVKNPSYTHEPSCRQLGVLRIEIPDYSKGKDRMIKIKFHFGYTNLKVSAVEEGTDHRAEVKFDCLSTTS